MLGLAVLTATPILLGALKVSGGVVRDNADLFEQFMISPIAVVFPLIAALLGCTVLSRDLAHRNITTARTRLDIRSLLLARMTVNCGVVALVFGASTFIVFSTAFYVWPLMGNASIDPEVYGLDARSASLDSYSRFSYAQLLESGPSVFGLFYSVWFGVTASVYAVIGHIGLAFLPNRAAAMTMPFGIYIVQTALMGIIDEPTLGLMYSAVPFGFASSPIAVAMTPTLVLVLVTAVAVLVLIDRAPRLVALS